jgi:hypothetical protein
MLLSYKYPISLASGLQVLLLSVTPPTSHHLYQSPRPSSQRRLDDRISVYLLPPLPFAHSHILSSSTSYHTLPPFIFCSLALSSVCAKQEKECEQNARAHHSPSLRFEVVAFHYLLAWSMRPVYARASLLLASSSKNGLQTPAQRRRRRRRSRDRVTLSKSRHCARITEQSPVTLWRNRWLSSCRRYYRDL